MQGQSLHNRQELDSAPTIVEQLQAATRQIHAMGQFIESKLDGACNLYSGMRLENPRRYAGARASFASWKYSACVLATCEGIFDL